MSFSTICAVATGGSSGAVSMIRLSGARARTIASAVVHQENWTPRHQYFCTLYDGENVLDQALVTYFQAPHSFTGEDVVEFAVHGSPYIKGRLLEILCEQGAVPARRGEFSQRAFLNGKMDLVQAQGLCDLIASGNKAAHAIAMTSLDGKLSSRIAEIKNTLSE
ncbi:MAG: tRNA uridine-5-carboxymethylaminomethyl(34) synthesis GTPase MnmE, partial [Elusimicrobiaceae bacterium]|nr:tRNA uridine-5-carboxymethylaminomethyl(34) synthesis GTPase MnmE [Elusimicrobiaceae bacterium]